MAQENLLKWAEDDYNKMFDLYEKGLLTLTEWTDYSHRWLEFLLKIIKKNEKRG